MAETTAPTGDRRKLAVAVTAGVAALAALVWLITGQTVAGFTAQTRVEDNTFTAGEVTITNNRVSRMFNLEGLLPGQTRPHQDIVITNGSDTDLTLRMFTDDVHEYRAVQDENGEYVLADHDDDPLTPDQPTYDEDAEGERVTTPTELAEYLNVTVQLVEGGQVVTEPVFTGTLAELADAEDWATGLSSADGGDSLLASSPDAQTPSTITYRITVGLDAMAGMHDVNPYDLATVTFIWEAQA